MRTIVARSAILLCVAALAAGCTSGNSAIEPAFQSANISSIGKLQFAIGTADIANDDGSAPLIGINTVVTLRNAKGGSAFAVDSPSIVGPPGFRIPSPSSSSDPLANQTGSDAGGNTIDYTPQLNGTTSTTFGTSGAATLYGFGPNNYGTSGAAPYGTYELPMYSDALDSDSAAYEAQSFNGLPPAFPAPPAGTGFTGYNLGFVPFAAAAVSGTYTLKVLIPTSAGSSEAPYTYSTTAALNAATVLPTLAPPTLTLDATGTGGTLAVVFPTGVTEIVVELADVTTASQATYVFKAASRGPQAVSDGTIATSGDQTLISAIGTDYDAFAFAAPANTQQTPPILGAAGQDDVTISAPLDSAATTGSHARKSAIRNR